MFLRWRIAEEGGGSGSMLSAAKKMSSAAKLRSPKAARIAAIVTGPFASSAILWNTVERRAGAGRTIAAVSFSLPVSSKPCFKLPIPPLAPAAAILPRAH